MNDSEARTEGKNQDMNYLSPNYDNNSPRMSHTESAVSLDMCNIGSNVDMLRGKMCDQQPLLPREDSVDDIIYSTKDELKGVNSTTL